MTFALHKNARTTPAIRAEIATSDDSAAALAQRFGFFVATIYEWKRRTSVLDAWFAGYQPRLAAVVWMGYDKPRSLGDHESGGRLALPIWTDYMASALKGVPVAAPPEPPAGLVRASDDWLYAEWANGGAVATLSDGAGAQLAGPPTLLDAIRELFSN